MNIKLCIVSKKKERKKGFYQAQYKDKTTKIQVLLHMCLQGVLLDKHKHKQLQFGYNFWGRYKFWIDKDLIYISSRDSYLINRYIEHKALALSDYYSIDIKYDGEINYDKVINIINKQDTLNIETIENKINICFVKNNSQFKANTLFIASKKAVIYLNKKKFIIEPMHIYKLFADMELNVDNILYEDNSDIKGEIVAVSIE